MDNQLTSCVTFATREEGHSSFSYRIRHVLLLYYLRSVANPLSNISLFSQNASHFIRQIQKRLVSHFDPYMLYEGYWRLAPCC